MRKISRHHAHHPDSGVPMCEVDMITDEGELIILHQEGIAAHPMSDRYTGDQIQIIEFVNNLLFNRKENIMTEEEIDYLLYHPNATARREKEVKPVEPEITAQPSIFGRSAPLITVPDLEPQVNPAVSLDGSFYPPEPEPTPEPEPIVEEVVVEEAVVEEPVVEEAAVEEPVIEEQPEPVVQEIVIEEPIIIETPVVKTKTKRKKKVAV